MRWAHLSDVQDVAPFGEVRGHVTAAAADETMARDIERHEACDPTRAWALGFARLT